MTVIARCPECYVAWETGQPEKHAMLCQRGAVKRETEGHIHQRRGEHPNKRRIHRRVTD